MEEKSELDVLKDIRDAVERPTSYFEIGFKAGFGFLTACLVAAIGAGTLWFLYQLSAIAMSSGAH